jgi:hypothetical protein
MKYRKLRIAWSVAWGITCILLILLWGRSRNKIDSIAAGYWPGHLILVESYLSDVYVGFYSGPVSLYRLSNEIRPSVYFPTLKTAALVVPLWALVLVGAVAASIPWIRWRFSLRTLLIATTLVAVVLGAVVYAMR